MQTKAPVVVSAAVLAAAVKRALADLWDVWQKATTKNAMNDVRTTDMTATGVNGKNETAAMTSARKCFGE